MTEIELVHNLLFVTFTFFWFSSIVSWTCLFAAARTAWLKSTFLLRFSDPSVIESELSDSTHCPSLRPNRPFRTFLPTSSNPFPTIVSSPPNPLHVSWIVLEDLIRIDLGSRETRWHGVTQTCVSGTLHRVSRCNYVKKPEREQEQPS